MAPSDDLKLALRAVAVADRPPADPAADLARARAAARERRRRRCRLALSGLTATTVLAVGAVTVLDPDVGPSRRPSAEPTARPSAEPSAPVAVRLVARSFAATPYTFDLTPEGWSVQGRSPYAVTIAPDHGGVSANPDDFRGKLVILFDANPAGGRVVDREGRRFWVTGDSGYTSIATRTRNGEPDGVVRIQYPLDAGWDRPAMLAFLGSVHVGPGARHGLG